MPYDKISELPDSVKDNLPETAQEIYKKAFNTADEDHQNWEEGRKHQYAWGAIKKVYEKRMINGSRKNN